MFEEISANAILVCVGILHGTRLDAGLLRYGPPSWLFAVAVAKKYPLGRSRLIAALDRGQRRDFSRTPRRFWPLGPVGIFCFY